MVNYFVAILGAILTPTFTGVRNPRNGRIISRKELKQLGVIVFSGCDNKEKLLTDAMLKGYDVVVSPDGTYASLYAPAPVTTVATKK